MRRHLRHRRQRTHLRIRRPRLSARHELRRNLRILRRHPPRDLHPPIRLAPRTEQHLHRTPRNRIILLKKPAQIILQPNLSAMQRLEQSHRRHKLPPRRPSLILPPRLPPPPLGPPAPTAVEPDPLHTEARPQLKTAPQLPRVHAAAQPPLPPPPRWQPPPAPLAPRHRVGLPLIRPRPRANHVRGL